MGDSSPNPKRTIGPDILLSHLDQAVIPHDREYFYSRHPLLPNDVRIGGWSENKHCESLLERQDGGLIEEIHFRLISDTPSENRHYFIPYFSMR
jgi:hypothetical protein